MTHKQVISQFQDWFEDRLKKEQKTKLERHLDECPECRMYFERMSLLLRAPDKDLFPELQPDPFMATRIKAMSRQKRHWFQPVHWLKWTLVGAATSLAILIGVEMGNSLYTITQADYGNEIVVTYYQAFSQNGIADQWQDVINSEKDTNK